MEEKEIVFGSFLASGEKVKTKANNSVQFSVVKQTAQKRMQKPLVKITQQTFENI